MKHTLTIALQNEMSVKIENNNVIIEIPDTCKRDLWDAQLSYWLEKETALKDSGYIRMKNDRMNLTHDKR